MAPSCWRLNGGLSRRVRGRVGSLENLNGSLLVRTRENGFHAGLARLDGQLGADRDRKRKLVPYGDALLPDDRKPIPESDMPPGTPPWMHSLRQWATRKGSTPDAKRATVEVRVPTRERPWE